VSRIGWLVLGLAAVILLALGVWLYRGLTSDEPPAIIGQIDTLPDTVITRERPKPPKTFSQKITKHRVPARVTISRGTPDTSLVRRFAAAVALADSLRRSNDSLREAGQPPLPLPSILPSAWGQYDGDRFTIWMSRSDGAVMRATAKLHPRWSFVAGVDKASEKVPIFTEERAWVRTIRQVKKCAPPAGLVAGVGALVNPQDRALGAAIGGIATLIGCLAG
jgi:hypothetical protein